MHNNVINATQAVAAGASPVSLFENPEFGSVRIIVKENGEPLFCLRDVAICLGYQNTSEAINNRCDNGVAICYPIQDSLGRTQEAKFGPESEVYRLIFGSKLDSAKKFQDWVFKEVLPSIRKTGSYSTEHQKVRMLPQSYAEALRELAATVEENERLALENKKQTREVTKLNSKIENDAPKVEMYNDLINSYDCISTTELAKIYKMSTMKFNAEMRAHGLYRVLDNLPLQKSINAGLFIVKEVPYTDKSGKKRINPKVYVTPKGQELIHNMFKAWEEYSGLFGD